jgi:hypothetical protein
MLLLPVVVAVTNPNLEIAMRNSTFMQVVCSIEHLLEQYSCLGFGDSSLGDYSIKQLTTSNTTD